MSDRDYQDELPAHHDSNINSINIDPTYPYSQQVEIVRTCLRASFGKYAQDIPLVNSFFGELDFLMDQLQASCNYKGEKEDAKYNELMEDVLLGNQGIMQYIIEHGKGVVVAIKKDLGKEGISENEAQDMIRGRMKTFTELLKQNIRFEEPQKENN